MDALTLHKILLNATQNRSRIGFEDLCAPDMTPLPNGTAAARLFMIQLSDAPNESFVVPCIDAISALPGWRDMLCEMLTNVIPSERTVRVMAGVLALQAPEHPISNVVNQGRLVAVNAFDAVDDGVYIRLAFDSGSPILEMSEGYLVSLADPVNVWAGCAVVRRDGNTLWFRALRDGALFAENRVVLPPAVLVAAIS